MFDYYSSFLISNWLLLKKGLLTTIGLWATTAIISLTTGIALGSLTSRNLKIPILSHTIECVAFVLRGVPFYVQLLIIYYVLPELSGINVSAFTSASLALGLCSGAYTMQIVKSGINAIPRGQWDAAYVLGYSPFQRLWHIILPQMFMNILPALLGEFDQLLKSTAVISSIGVLELTGSARALIAKTGLTIPVYCTIALMYLGLSSIMQLGSKLIERKWHDQNR